MANPLINHPLSNTFVLDTDYINRWNSNNSNLYAAFEEMDLRTASLEGSTTIGGAADAAGNIANLLVNGDFQTHYSYAYDSANATAYAPVWNAGNSIEAIYGCDCWFMEPTSGIQGDMQVANLVPGGPPTFYNELRFSDSGQPDQSGVVFQRVDISYDLQYLKNKQVQFYVKYTSVGADEFYLEIDDGVTVSGNSSVSIPAGTNFTSVSHIVDSNATKLTFRIVIWDNVAATNGLKIQHCYGRIGVAAISPVSFTPPPRHSFESTMAQLYSGTVNIGQSLLTGSFDGLGNEVAGPMYFPFAHPVLWEATGTVTQDAFLFPAIDVRATSLLAVPPAFTYFKGSTEIQYFKPTYEIVFGVQLIVGRTPVDPPILPWLNGFLTPAVSAALMRLIPSP